MSHSHDHAGGPGDHGGTARQGNRRALASVLALTTTYTIAEVVGGVLTGSLALLADVDVEQLGVAMASVEGVREVHDLHVWTITSGFPALAAHVLVGEGDDCQRTSARARAAPAGTLWDRAHNLAGRP